MKAELMEEVLNVEPLVKGGQGRNADQLQMDADNLIACILLAGLVVIVAIVLRSNW